MSTHVTLAFVAHTQKATFTVHEISVNVNTCFQRLDQMISRFARSDLDFPNLGIRKLCHANGYRHGHVDPQFARGKHLNKHVHSHVCVVDAGWTYVQRNQTRRSRNHNVLFISCNTSKGVFSILALQTIKWMLAINANNYVFVRHVS